MPEPSDRQQQRPAADTYLPMLEHTLFVKKLKLIVVAIASILILILIIWPLTNIGQRGFKLTFKNIEASEEDDQPRMIKPRFHGVDSKDRPYSVTADQATQVDADNVTLENVNGDILYEDGAWMSLLSKSGYYNIPNNTLDLSGSVNIFTESGYEFRTEKAQMFLDEGRAVGKEPLILQGPLGTLKAQGFLVKGDGKEIIFEGGVHLTVYPES